MIQLSHVEGSSSSVSSGGVIVVRAYLGLMGFAVDFVSLQEVDSKVVHVEYEDMEVLCDRQFKDNKKTITN